MIPSIASCRHIRFNPAISIGSQAMGISAREVRMRFAPDKGMHAAHRCPKDQAEPCYPKLLQHQPLCFDHVVIVIFGELHPETVRRLGRFSMADIVREDDPIAVDVQRLAEAVQFVGKLRPQELLTAPPVPCSTMIALSISPAALRCGFPRAV